MRTKQNVIPLLILATSFSICSRAEDSISPQPIIINVSASSVSGAADQKLDVRIFRLGYILLDEINFLPVLFSEVERNKASQRADVTGQSIVDVLKKFKSTDGTITTDAHTNSLVVRDTPDRLDQMQKIIDVLDNPSADMPVEANEFVANTEGGG